MKLESINCDFCGQNNTELLYTYIDPLNLSNLGFNYVICKNCSLIYLNPRPDKNEIIKYYPEDYAPYQKSIKEEKNRLIKIMRFHNVSKKRIWIEKNCKLTSGTILDVGCSTGIFLNEMQEKGWKAVGVEISQFAGDYAKKKFNLDVKIGEFEENDFAARSLDVITFWDVLEHTFSPIKQIRLSNHFLRNNGFLIINIPNWNSFDRKLFNRFWVGFDPPRHLYIFTEEVLTRILQENGFEVIKKQCFISSYFGFIITLENIISARNENLALNIKDFLLIPGLRLFFEPFLKVINHLNQGTVITYIAQKKSES